MTCRGTCFNGRDAPRPRQHPDAQAREPLKRAWQSWLFKCQLSLIDLNINSHTGRVADKIQMPGSI